MTDKVGRNDPCPCGSGKKYKACCMLKAHPTAKKKFSATVVGRSKPVDLMERTFGNGIARTKQEEFKTPPSNEQEEYDKGHMPM